MMLVQRPLRGSAGYWADHYGHRRPVERGAGGYTGACYPDVESLLDVGCGNGAGLTALRGWAGEDVLLAGCDISPAAVALTRAAGFRAFVADVENDIERDPARFDIVLCFDTLEHLVSPVEGLRFCLRRARQAIVVRVPRGTAMGGQRDHLWQFDEGDFAAYDPEVEVVFLGDGPRLQFTFRDWE